MLEHVNLTVSDPERSSALLQKMMGWRERWRGAAQNGGWTIHVGSRDNYVALYTDLQTEKSFSKGEPLNHVGLLVDDLTEAERIVVEAGLEPFGHADYEPGRRFYSSTGMALNSRSSAMNELDQALPTTKQAAATRSPANRLERKRASAFLPSSGSSVATCQKR